MPYRIWNTSKKPNGRGRNRNGYTIQVGERTIYHGSAAVATDEIWLLIEKKMTELAAIGDIKIEPIGVSKTPDIVKDLDAMIAEERERALTRSPVVAPVDTNKSKITQTGYESGNKVPGYDPNVDEDDLPFADEVGHNDPDAIVPQDNFTVVASEGGAKKKRK